MQADTLSIETYTYIQLYLLISFTGRQALQWEGASRGHAAQEADGLPQ